MHTHTCICNKFIDAHTHTCIHNKFRVTIWTSLERVSKITNACMYETTSHVKSACASSYMYICIHTYIYRHTQRCWRQPIESWCQDDDCGSAHHVCVAGVGGCGGERWCQDDDCGTHRHRGRCRVVRSWCWSRRLGGGQGQKLHWGSRYVTWCANGMRGGALARCVCRVIYIYIYIYIYIQKCTHTDTHEHAYMDTHTSRHTHIHIHKRTNRTEIDI
jgi:hypothetical protein